MKNTLKKVLFSLWIAWLLGAWSLWMVNATWNDSTNTFWNPVNWWRTNDDWQWWIAVVWNEKNSVSTNYQQNNLVPTIKRFINWVLGMLSLIALVICLRGWFQMLTAAGDEGKYKKWFTILKQAAIALAVIGLSWLFVTLILYLINKSSA